MPPFHNLSFCECSEKVRRTGHAHPPAREKFRGKTSLGDLSSSAAAQDRRTKPLWEAFQLQNGIPGSHNQSSNWPKHLRVSFDHLLIHGHEELLRLPHICNVFSIERACSLVLKTLNDAKFKQRFVQAALVESHVVVAIPCNRHVRLR